MVLTAMKFLWFGLVLNATVFVVSAQCPWSHETADRNMNCSCAYNNVQRLSVQCSLVNLTNLMAALRKTARNVPIDLLNVKNTMVLSLSNYMFRYLDIWNLRILYSNIANISENAFQGLEQGLNSLKLEGNNLSHVPTEQINRLTSLKLLDLSNNKISLISDGAFQNLQLVTLKLDHNKKLLLSKEAFRGLENSLKNLNLRSAGLEEIPSAIKTLRMLTFLDLGENGISRVEPGIFKNMSSLAVINLERNKIKHLSSSTFYGVNATLKTLSLLSNIIEEFPSDVLSVLTNLRVLDLGFNKLVQVPESALKNTPHLTLLALDGNPLETLPLAAFTHLNSTLRWLSIGGSHLKCDCRIRWVAQWIRKYNLQLTSRDRNPKFCSHSEPLKDKLFAQIAPSELICDNETVTTTSSRTDTFLLDTSTFPLPKDLNKLSSVFVSFHDAENPSGTDGNTITEEFIFSSGKTLTTSPFSNLRTPSGLTKTLPPPTSVQDNINIFDAYRRGSSVVIEWEPKFDNSSRVRVIYRYFGETVFHQSSVLDPSQRQHIIPDLPASSCVVVCVTTIEDISNTTRDFLHYSWCREIKNDRFIADFFFKVVTAAATSVSALVIVTLVVFVCCLCRRKKSVLPPPSTTSLPPLTLDHEWETMSIYSGRSIPRVRISYVDPALHADRSYYNHSFLMDESRLYTSPFSHMSDIYTSVRSAVDSQSQNSYSQLSNKYGNNYCLGSPEMYKSEQHQFSDHLDGSPPRKKKPRRYCLTTAGFLHEYDNDGNVKSNDVSQSGCGDN